MEQRKFGNRGLMVSELCLGAMTFGREATAQESHKILDCFVDAGGTFIDTADVYNDGKSEEIIGQWLRDKQRNDFVIATKVRFPMGKGANDAGLSRRHIIDSVDKSLQRLGVDYIDLYQAHCWDPRTPLEETLSTFNDLVRSGKVRYIGVSNFLPSQVQRAIDISRAHGWEAFCSLQPLYNMLDRFVEWELMEVCREEKLAVIPWSPLRGGWLSGKYKKAKKAPPPNTRVKMAEEFGWSETWKNYSKQRTWRIVNAVQRVARKRGKSMAQVAINWLKDRPGVTAPIIGARDTTQLTDNLGAAGWVMHPIDRKQLDKISTHVPPYYPHGFVEEMTK